MCEIASAVLRCSVFTLVAALIEDTGGRDDCTSNATTESCSCSRLPDFGKLTDALIRDLGAFLPELVLCGAIVLLLMLRLFSSFNRVHLGWFALLATVVALAVSVCQWGNFFGFTSPENAENRVEQTRIRLNRQDVEGKYGQLAKSKAKIAEAQAALDSARAQTPPDAAAIARLEKTLQQQQHTVQQTEVASRTRTI